MKYQLDLAFWNKEYDHSELMKDSRWLLIFIGAANIIMGWIRYSSALPGGDEDSALGIILIGGFSLGAAFVPSFWTRLVFIFLWIADLVYINLIMGRMHPVSIIFIVVGTVFIYKMLKYRGTKNVTLPMDDPGREA